MLANERRTIRSDQLEKKKEVPEARGGEGKGERERGEEYVDLWQHTRCARDSFCFSFVY